MKSYGFRYTAPYRHGLLIVTIGHQVVTDSGYDWSGINRGDQRTMLFQYTLSGRGELVLGGNHYALPGGHAFLVNVPGDHRYYYDASAGEPWELLWVRFSGAMAFDLWSDLLSGKTNDRIVGYPDIGCVMELRPDSAPIALLWKMYYDVMQGSLREPAAQSVRMYEWLLSILDRGNRALEQTGESMEPAFSASIRFVKEHYKEPLTLEQLAACEGLSKYHYCKSFHKAMRISPMAYVSRVRIEEAAKLLAGTSLPVAQIAAMTGFDNVGYFGKVFRRYVGMTPTEYREEGAQISQHELRLV
jgi:AraC-like DNA-binding protein